MKKITVEEVEKLDGSKITRDFLWELIRQELICGVSHPIDRRLNSKGYRILTLTKPINKQVIGITLVD